MRLLTKTNLLHLGITLVGLIGLVLLSFHFLKVELAEETDEALLQEKEMVAQIFAAWPISELDSPSLPAIEDLSGGTPSGIHPIFIHRVQGPLRQMAYMLADTTLAEKDEGDLEMVPYRLLSWQQQIGSQVYEISLLHPSVEDDDTFEALTKALIPAALGVILLMFLLQWASSKVLWRPFHHNLRQLALFQPDGTAPIHFLPTSTQEFRELSLQLEQVLGQLRKDFQNLKSFTENASHELQTPIAMAQAKLEELLQSPALGSREVNTANAALQALNRMRRLNEALLLLSKIENRQFKEWALVSWDDVISEQIAASQELAGLKQLHLSYVAGSNLPTQLNPMLCEILVSNLLSNAIRHTAAGGAIVVSLDARGFQIANTAENGGLDQTRLFHRFGRMGNQGQGLGLGLAIVQEICKAMHLQITYEFDGQMHIFRVSSLLQN